MTLEHVPPEGLRGSPICLTCSPCNNGTSRIDERAILAKRARDEWSLGQGTRVEVDFFGVKKSLRYIPNDAQAPLPTRVSQLRNGSIRLGKLPRGEALDSSKGVRFRMLGTAHYESVGMVKAAYLMVLSLMGPAGYGFGGSAALGSVREQIMNPARRALRGCFVSEGTIPGTEKTSKPMVFLCHGARPPFWIVPMWNEKVVMLPCGGPDPIDELIARQGQIEIANSQVTGWTTCRFHESVAIAGAVSGEVDTGGGTLVGTTGLVPTDAGQWEWMVVNHHMAEYVALPFRPAGAEGRSDSLNVVEALGEHSARGRGLDAPRFTRVNRSELRKARTITGLTRRTPS